MRLLLSAALAGILTLPAAAQETQAPAAQAPAAEAPAEGLDPIAPAAGADAAKEAEAAREGEAPVLVTSAAIRPFVRSLVERFRAQTTVLSQAEIHPRARLKTVGSI